MREPPGPERTGDEGGAVQDPESERDAGARETSGQGEEGARSAGLAPEEEPRTTGTLLILMLFMMALAAMWAIMYLTLLGR